MPQFFKTRLDKLRILAALLIAGSIGASPQLLIAQPALEAETGAAAGAMQTVAVVALSGYDPLMEDIGYLGALGGRPEGAQMIEGMINLFTQGKGLEGMDKTKPWGVVVQTDGNNLLPLVCLPINDLDAILALAEGFGVMSDDAGNGVKELTVPNSPMPLFAKKMGDWVYVSQSAESLDSAPADPTSTLSDLVEAYDIGARVLAQNIPAMWKQMAIGGLRQGMEEGLQQEPDESDAEYEARREIAEIQVEQLLDMIEQTESFTIGVAINESVGPGIVMEFAFSALPGSDLASQFKSLEESSTNLAGFKKKNATLSIHAAATTPPEILAQQAEQNQAALAAARKQFMTAIDKEMDIPNDAAREVIKSAAGDVFDAYVETALAGVLDMQFSASVSPDEMTMLGGALVKSPEKVETAIRKLAELAADQPDFPGVNWNVAEHQGVRFHSISIPIPPDAEGPREVLGDQIDLAFGFGPGHVYVAGGSDWMANITTAIDESKAKGPTPTTPMEMTFALNSLLQTIKNVGRESDRKAVAMVADVLEDSPGEDKVRLSLVPHQNGMIYRMEVEEGLLKAIGQAAGAAAAQAGGGPPPQF